MVRKDWETMNRRKVLYYLDEVIAEVAGAALNTRPVVVGAAFTSLSIQRLFTLFAAVLRVTAL